MTTPYINPYTQRDTELYEAWKKNPSPQTLGNVISALMPLAGKEVSRGSGSLPQTALLGEAKKWLVQAVKTYDPTKGVALSTHATNYLQKVRRMNYQYANVARLPESKQLQFHTYSSAVSELSEALGRPPTDDELAARLGWSKKQTVKFGGMIYKDWGDHASGVDSPHYEYDRRNVFLEELKSKLTPQELALFSELMKKEKTSNPDLARKLSLTVPQISVLKASLKKKADNLKDLLD